MSGHGHSHGGGGCEGDHDHAPESDMMAAYSLYLKIDTERVQCLNEAEEGSAKYIFKPWDQRLDKEKVFYLFCCYGSWAILAKSGNFAFRLLIE